LDEEKRLSTRLTFGQESIQWHFLFSIKIRNKKYMGEKEYLTKERYNTLSEELEYLKKTKRREVADQLEYAKSLGDLSENAEYHEARDAQGVIEDRIKKLEDILKNAAIVSSHKTDTVAVGSVVTVEKNGDKNEVVYTLVGGEETDLSQGKISIHSPFGKAAIDKKRGESFTFNAPSGPITYKIISIK
jgi:transcription elongation factor GreA